MVQLCYIRTVSVLTHIGAYASNANSPSDPPTGVSSPQLLIWHAR